MASLMAALTSVSAYIILPIGPVPITMQTCFVLLSGAVLGSRWGAGSQMAYICLGLAGIPVFASGTSGLGVVLVCDSPCNLRRALLVSVVRLGRGWDKQSAADWVN